MIAPPIPLVWAKLEVPRLPDHAIDRPGLVERLAAPGAALAAIVAPAGYGKTTAAVQLTRHLAASDGGALAWLSLEPGDDEPVRFWTYVAAALCAAGVEGADETYAILTGGEEAVADASLALRSRIEVHGQPVRLVLDDVQWITDPAIESALSDWLRHPLANLTVVCTSRSDLPLPVGRLRGQGRLAEARLDALAFDTAESAELLHRTFGLPELDAARLEALYERTEGWPVGLYLAGLTLRDLPDVDDHVTRFTGDSRHLDDYLAAEAMDGISDDMRAFALATSIAPVLYPDLCDAVTDGTGSLRILRELAADNLFISALDDANTVFRFHPLFREHLRSALEEHHPEQVAELHARASTWHEQQGEDALAIEHATLAGQLDRAEQLIIEHFLPYVNAGHFATVAGWVDALGPREERGAETALAMAWMSLNLRRYGDLDRWLDIAACNATDTEAANAVAVQRPSILLHRARHDGDVGAMERRATEAIAAASRPAVETHGTRFVDEGRRAAFSASASAAYWGGRPDEARSHARAALGARDTAMLMEHTFCYQYLAMVAADAGDHHAALAHADQVLSRLAPAMEPTHQPTLAHLARSIALRGLGRIADADAALTDARRVASHRSEPLDDAAIELQQALLHHDVGAQESARAALRTARAIVADLPDPRFDGRIRAAENAIRFVARDAAALPVGARELTDRERAVLHLLPHRLGRRELARQLHVSENTVKTHLTSIRHKLGVNGRASIVDRAIELGLLDIDTSG